MRRELLFGSCKDLQPSLLVDELCFDINATFIFGFFDLGRFPKPTIAAWLRLQLAGNPTRARNSARFDCHRPSPSLSRAGR